MSSLIAFHFFEVGLYWSWIFANSARLAGRYTQGIPSSQPHPQHWKCRQETLCLAFYVCAGDLNLGPYVCQAYWLSHLSIPHCPVV